MTSDAYRPYAIRGVVYGQWAYWGTLGTAIWSYAYMPQGSIRTALILTPILPALLIVAVAYWLYQACDGYAQSRILSRVPSSPAVSSRHRRLALVILDPFLSEPIQLV